MKCYRQYALLAALVVALFGATPIGRYRDGVISSGTRSDSGGTIGSGTRTGGMSFLDDEGYFGSGH